MRSTFAVLTVAAVVNAAVVQLVSESSAYGAAAVIHDCNEDAAKHTVEAFINTGPAPIMFFGGAKCLDVVDGVKAPGSKLQLWTCNGLNTNQEWVSREDHTFQWSGTDLCIDLTDGKADDNNQLQVWTCDSNNQNQRFTAETPAANSAKTSTGQFSTFKNDTRFCLTAESDTDGAALGLSVCGNVTDTYANGNQTFTIPLIPPFLTPPVPGPVSTFNGNKCIDVPNGNNTNGQSLQVWSCVEGSTNQQWEWLEEWGTFTWVGKNKCIDLPGGNAVAGARLQLWDCDSFNVNQQWRYAA